MSLDTKLSAQFPTLGVKVSAFRELIDKVGGRSAVEGLTTSDMCKNFIRPITATGECSYCEYLQRQGDPSVAQANVFISHAWRFKFIDVMETLEYHFRSNPNAVVWFDLFSNNQHAAPNLDFDWWSTTFKNAIFLFNHTVLILYPWEDPIPLTRAWCLWEIYCTITTNSKFEIAMCASERESFLSDIQVNFCSLSAMIARVNVAKSEARPIDKERIFEAVRNIEGGFDQVNSIVFQTLRNWAIETMRAAILIADGNERVYLIGSLAIVYRRYGMYDLAEPCARYACECAINRFGKHDAFTLKCQNELVLLLDKRGKHADACECARLCMEARQRHLGATHPDTLSSMTVLGNILCTLKRYNEAEPLLVASYDNSRVALGENHPDTLKSMFALANLYFAEQKYDLAEPLYSRHPDSEHCKHFLMTIHAAQGKYEETRDYFTSHYEFSRTKLGPSHPETLIYMHNLALIYSAMNMCAESIAMFKDCVEQRRKVLGADHPDTLQSCYHLGRVMQSIGHIGAAADVLGDTLQIQRRVLGPNHPDTQATALVLDDLGFYLPFMRYLVPMAICPMYYIGCGVKLAFKSVRGLFVAMEIGSLPDVTLIHDNLDENSIDEYNARQLLRGGAPLADECPIAAFIREVAPKSLKSGHVQLTQGALVSAVASALAPEYDDALCVANGNGKSAGSTTGSTANNRETSEGLKKLEELKQRRDDPPVRPAYNRGESIKKMSELSTNIRVTVVDTPPTQTFTNPPPPPAAAAVHKQNAGPVVDVKPSFAGESPAASPTKSPNRKGSLANVLATLPFLQDQEAAAGYLSGPADSMEGTTSSGWSFLNVFNKNGGSSKAKDANDWDPSI